MKKLKQGFWKMNEIDGYRWDHHNIAHEMGIIILTLILIHTQITLNLFLIENKNKQKR